MGVSVKRGDRFLSPDPNLFASSRATGRMQGSHPFAQESSVLEFLPSPWIVCPERLFPNRPLHEERARCYKRCTDSVEDRLEAITRLPGWNWNTERRR